MIRKLPKLHSGQAQVVQSSARFKVLAAGRRWGKTRLGVALTTRVANNGGGRAWWVAPAYPQGLVGWRLMKGLSRQIDGTKIREAELMIEFPGGGWEQVKSADNPDSLRGEGLNLVVIDECAHMKNFDQVWGPALRPALSDRRGHALFISTPKGYNDFYELYRKDDKDWERFRFASWENPYIEAEEIEKARQDLPALIFRQEYGAEFVQLAGAIFDRTWFTILDKAPEARYARAWDLATSTKKSADFTCGAKVGMTSEGQIIISHMARGRYEWPDALKTIKNTAQVDGPAVRQGVEDVGMQKGMYQTLMREPSLAGIGFTPITVHKDKLTRWMPLLARAEQGKVALVRGGWNKEFLDEIAAVPESRHDDQTDACALALELLGRSAGPLAVLI